MASRTSDELVAGLVHEFQHGDSQTAWREFLRDYAHVIAQVVSFCEREEENRADAFVFLCEQLHNDNCRRLRKFDPQGPASFTTWLRAVARNLCRDWRRKQFGRLREGGSPTESRDSSSEHLLMRLALSNCLSLDDETDPVELPDPSPSPEALVQIRQSEAGLAKAMSSLSEGQRLAITLRVEEDLTLLEISCIMHLKNAQAVDRLIRDAIQKLRGAMGLAPQPHGKEKPASV